MELKVIIYDAIDDFSRRTLLDIDREYIANLLLLKMGWSVERYGAENIYALVIEFMYCYLLDESSELKNIEDNSMEVIIQDYLSHSIEWHIERDETFKWYPKVLDQVWNDSHCLFEMAKDAYVGNRNIENTEKANSLFERILSVRETLEQENYRYRSKEDILDLYEHEISESQLDLDLISEESIFLSFRLSYYICSLDDSTGETLDFSCDAPFSMPDDLFQD
ncbi:hypothetical protein [Faecalimonas sp.]